MRILHLLSQNILTGAEVYAQTLLEEQKRQGHEVFVISDRMHVPLSVPWVSKPISVNQFATRLSNVRFVRQFLIENKIDVIHAHSRAASRIAHKSRKGLGVGYVTTIHGRQHSSFGKKFFDSYGDYKILICENLRTQFEKDFRIAQGSTHVIRNPFAENLPALQSSARKNHIAFIGRSSGPKGQRLVELFRQGLFQHLKAHPELRFDIVAGEPANFGAEFLEQIAKPEWSKQIRLLDHQGNLAEKLTNYDLVFAAGRVAIESLLVGTPVLSFGEATSHGVLTEKNWAENLASNFGDITANDVRFPEAQFILKELDQFLSAPAPTLENRRSLQSLALQEFSLSKVSSLILDTYKAALFKRHVPNGIPTLMYHKVVTVPENGQHRIFVSQKTFETHLELFQRCRKTTMTFKEISDFWHLRKPYSQWPKTPLVLTFDDGYRDNFENALPLLQKFKMKAVLFLLSDVKIQNNNWDPVEPGVSNQLMSASQRREIAASGFYEIGSHGVSHPHLPQLSDNEILHEMTKSKADLAQELQQSPIAFAYPFGDLDSRLPGLARKAGYEFAVNTDRGGLHFADNRFSLFRVNVFPEDGVFAIWKKSSSFYRRRYFKKRGQ